jgi:hypothetical protein
MARLSYPPRSCRAVTRSLLIAAVVAACVVVAGDAIGCPNCKDAVNTSDPEGLNVARGYFYSILIMLAMPCTLISSFGIYVWREMQRQKRAGLTDAGQAVDGSPLFGHPGYGGHPGHGGHHHRPPSEPITLPHS